MNDVFGYLIVLSIVLMSMNIGSAIRELAREIRNKR